MICPSKDTLSRITLTVKGQNNSDGTFDWYNAIIDAGIITAVSVAISFGAVTSDAIVTISELGAIISGAVLEFFGFLATKRKLRSALDAK